MADVLLAIALVLIVSRVLRGGMERLGQPPVMSEVLAGLVLGASLLGDPLGVFTTDTRAVLKTLGEIALVGFIFTVVAELDRRALRREGRTAVRVAAASFAVPFAAGAMVALAVHDRVQGDPPTARFALFLATAMAVTALPILARIVAAQALGRSPSGRIALAAAAGQELLVWPLVSVAVASGAPAWRWLGALALVAVAARVLAPRLPAPLVLAALGLSAAATQWAGLHLILGAFLFAALVPAVPRDAACGLLRSRTAVLLSATLLPLFFALPALDVDLGMLDPGLFAVLLAVAVVTKFGSAALAAGGDLTVGALMNARGLVELVVLGVGLEAGLIDGPLYAALVLVALATTFATGPAVALIGARPRTSRPLRPAEHPAQ